MRQLLTLLVVPATTVVICVAAAKTMGRYTPRLFAFSNGGRDPRSKEKPTVADAVHTSEEKRCLARAQPDRVLWDKKRGRGLFYVVTLQPGSYQCDIRLDDTDRQWHNLAFAGTARD